MAKPREALFLKAALWPALGFFASTTAFATGWGGSVGAASDYVFRGVTRSDGEPSAQVDLHYFASARAGWFVGAGAATVRLPRDYDTSAEFNGYLGYARTFGDDWSGKLSYVHYDYPLDSPRRQYAYDEFSGTFAYRDRAALTVAASPDTAAITRRGTVTGRAAFSYDLAFHQPLPHALSANAGVGYYDLHRLVGAGYYYWNVGLGYDLGRFQLDVSYIGVDGTAKSLYNNNTATNRVVATVLWHF